MPRDTLESLGKALVHPELSLCLTSSSPVSFKVGWYPANHLGGHCGPGLRPSWKLERTLYHWDHSSETRLHPSIVQTPSGSFLLLLHFGASLAMLAWFEVRDLESLFGSWKSQREDFPTGLWGLGKGGHTMQDREGWPRALLLPFLHVWTTHTQGLWRESLIFPVVQGRDQFRACSI